MAGFTRRRLLQTSAALAMMPPIAAACSKANQAATTAAPETLERPKMPATDFADGVRQAEMIAAGETTSLALTEAAIARAKASQPLINAIATETYDAALEAASAPVSGAFQGVPTFIKDLLNWEGAPTLYGSRAFKGYMPETDAPFASAWRNIGVVSLGKSTTPEEGLISSTEPLVTGATRNPWDLNRIPGGSSGGAAALVAARVVPFAHASDGGGSIRIPAAACGLFGLKPSVDAVPPSRTAPAPITLSVNHAVTLTVRDSAALFSATTLYDAARQTPVTGPASKRLRIAFAPDPATAASLDSATRSGIERTAQLCRELGHEVIDYQVPLNGDEFSDKFLLYWCAGAAQFAQDAARFAGEPPNPDILEPWTLGLAMQYLQRQGEMPETIAYLKAFEAQYHSWFDDFDVLLTPAVSTLPPQIGEQAPDANFETVMQNVTNYAAFTSPMNVSGAASMSVPLQWSEDGLPIGSMFSAKKGDDTLLLALAFELEAAQPWIDRVPNLQAG